MTSSIDAESPIENAALRLNTLHHHLDMPRRRREARVAAEGLLDVEVMARALAGMEPGEDWPTNEALGGSLTGTRDDEFRDGMLDQARAVRAALLGESA